jgi:two-component system chemotaxis response regulator CheY
MLMASAIKVLIVDDLRTNRAILRDSLVELGFREIEMASDGEQALKVLTQKPIHLIISDLNMPKLDGIGFLRTLRANPAASKIAFIMLTVSTDRELIEKAAKYGVNNYLVKPFTLPSLKGALEAVLGPLS